MFSVHALDFHGSVPNFRNRSGGGILLDIKPAFSEAGVYERLDSYGEEGRRIYSFRNATVDVVLPLSLLPFLFLFMLKAFEALHLSRLQRLFLLSLSIVYALFDFAENAAVLVLLKRFPDRIHLLAVVLPYLTTVKRTASILSFVLPLAIFASAFVRNRFGGPLLSSRSRW